MNRSKPTAGAPREADLNRVATFVHTVQAGSFAAAARTLGLPANTVSRRVQQLEAELGTRLLHRSTRKLSLTTAGQQFFAQSAAGIAQVRAAGQALADALQQPSGLLRVAAPADFFDHFHFDWLAEYMARYPRVHLDFRLGDGFADLVADGIDLAFRGGRLPDSGLVARRLFDVELQLVASPGYLATRGQPAAPADLARHACLTQAAPQGGCLWRLDGQDGDGASAEVRVGSGLSVSTGRALLGATLAGLGIALLPVPIVEPLLQQGRLARLLPGWCQRGGGFHAVYPHRAQRSPAGIALVDFFVEKVLLPTAAAVPG